MSLKFKSPLAPSISVIIISLNEEFRLPKLLACLKRQTFKNFEVIVADARSTDKTRAIAKQWGARVVEGGPVAVGRNAGAKAAKGSLLVFLDADVTFTNDFLSKIYESCTLNNYDLAACWSQPDSKRLSSKFFYNFFNVHIWLGQRFSPRVPGYCIIATRSLYKKLGGFDVRVQFEDTDFSARARGKARYGIVPVTVTVADRRFVPGNRWNTLRTLLRVEFDRLLGIRRFYWYSYPFGEHLEQRKGRTK